MVLYGLAVLGLLFIGIVAIAITHPSHVNPKVIECGCLHPTPIVQDIGYLTPHIKFVDTGIKYNWDNTTTYYAYLKNEGKSGDVLVKLQFHDKDMNLLKEYTDKYYFNKNEAKKVQFIVHAPENTSSYRFSTKSLEVPEYYANIKNNGTSGKIIVVLQFKNKYDKIIKNYSKTIYLKSGESEKVKFYVEPPKDTASYNFHAESLEVPEYYVRVKNIGNDDGKIKVILRFIDNKGNIIKEYTKFDYLDKKETKKISFFVNTPKNTSKYEFNAMAISD
jgi:hypothetical protein